MARRAQEISSEACARPCPLRPGRPLLARALPSTSRWSPSHPACRDRSSATPDHLAPDLPAVRCATEIQAALRTRNDQLAPQRQVRFRIGINLGDVMVQEGDLLGDGVNVAARLQAAAEPGGI